MGHIQLRKWQAEALSLWRVEQHRGIVSVVTGGGKTVFALACIEELRPFTTLVVVPTAALLDQWWEECASYFGLPLDEINIVAGNRGLKAGTINLAVINTAAALPRRKGSVPCFLIVDECHKAAAGTFSHIFELETVASLGLSATPTREYDDGLNAILIPALGRVIYQYEYADAKRDGVIVPFALRNVVFDLEEARKIAYTKLTQAIAKTLRAEGPESQKLLSLLLKRARLVNGSERRIVLTLRLVASNRDKRTLVFHEDIESCDVICNVLQAHSIRAGVYHSRMTLRARAEMLAQYRSGSLQVLVSCRALDEGFNVPETEIGIIAASTATRRQRIQRLGRILRPSAGKSGATVYTLVATAPEIDRLKVEEESLDGIAEVSWGRA